MEDELLSPPMEKESAPVEAAKEVEKKKALLAKEKQKAAALALEVEQAVAVAEECGKAHLEAKEKAESALALLNERKEAAARAKEITAAMEVEVEASAKEKAAPSPSAPAAGKDFAAPSLTPDASAGIMTTGGCSTGSQIHAIDNDPDLFLLSVNEPTHIVKFDVTVAQAHLSNQNWKELEAYVLKFLKDAQVQEFHSHSGLMFSLYQTHIASLIQRDKFDEATTIFIKEVETLDLKDDLYLPMDLVERINLLKTCVDSRKAPAESEDLMTVISDYLLLNFPESLGETRKGSVRDFVRPVQDVLGKNRYRCLACQWVIPDANKVQPIAAHIDYSNHRTKRCRRVTKWMRSYLASLPGQSGSLNVEKRNSRKRKFPDVEDISVPVGDAVDVFCDLLNANMNAVVHLKEATDPVAVKAREIVMMQHKLLIELKDLVMNSTIDHRAFSKARELGELSEVHLLPLMKQLPDVSGILEKQAAEIFALRLHYFTKTKELSLAASSTGATNTKGASVPDTPGTNASEQT